jgi:vacuolar-type H+-ATPase catalytic subunit A/Vma1
MDETFGEPINLAGKALAIKIYEDVAWIAENTSVVRKLDLEVGMGILETLSASY